MSKLPVNPAQISMLYTGQNLTVVLEGKPYNIPKETAGFDQLLNMIREGKAEKEIKDYIERDVRRLQ